MEKRYNERLVPTILLFFSIKVNTNLIFLFYGAVTSSFGPDHYDE